MDRLIKNNCSTTLEFGQDNRITKDEKDKLIRELIRRVFLKTDNIIENSNITYTIDRFEGNYAVCENRDTKEMTNIEISKLPFGIHEGDILKYENGIYKIDDILRKEIEQRINDKINNLFED